MDRESEPNITGNEYQQEAEAPWKLTTIKKNL